MLEMNGVESFSLIKIKNSLKVIFSVGKPLETFVVLCYFNDICLICSLKTAESLYFTMGVE